MRAALRGSYIEYVYYMGVSEKYPQWFVNEVIDDITVDEFRYTTYHYEDERSADYHEKTLVEDWSVVIRKPNGDIHVTDYETFRTLYEVFRFDGFTNSGVAGFKADCIDYVECTPGFLQDHYPDWFYEYFMEVINFPNDETLFVCGDDYVSINSHSVFLRNKFGEIKPMSYKAFIKLYDPSPKLGEHW